MYSVESSSAENRATTTWLEIEEGPSITVITMDDNTNTRLVIAPPVFTSPEDGVTTMEIVQGTDQLLPDEVIHVAHTLRVYVYGHHEGMTVARGQIASKGKGKGKGGIRAEPY